jgi:exodeoxyribonuclease-3
MGGASIANGRRGRRVVFRGAACKLRRVKLASWNVNGLRAALRAGLLDWLDAERPDAICLQEVKAHPDQVDAEALTRLGYRVWWHPAQRPGYSGVVTLSRHEPVSVAIGMGRRDVDREGRVLQVEFPDFVLVNAYFPNSQRDHARLGFKLSFCRSLALRLGALRRAGKHVVLCGDYNIAHQPIDLRNPKQNEKNAGFLPEERAWLGRFLARGWVDCFRSLCDEPGHYTWWSQRVGVRERNIGWRIDYFCIDEGLAPRLIRADHQPEVRGSDHCPIRLELDA